MGLYDYMASRGNMLTFLEFIWDLRLSNIVFKLKKKKKSDFFGQKLHFLAKSIFWSFQYLLDY
jgi:hypothetical protein